jgi:hypothetical protein
LVLFLTAIGADETQIETSFRAAITTAKGQKSVSLAKRAEATYAEYRRRASKVAERRTSWQALTQRALRQFKEIEGT